MKLTIISTVVLCLAASAAQAQNPIIRDQFSADPTARVFNNKVQYTYGELDRQSDILARQLNDCGIGLDDFVGIMLRRRKEFLLCVLAVHKAGAAYIPLDMEYPAERLRYMLDDAGAKALLTNRDILEEKIQNDGLQIDADTVRTFFVEDTDMTVDAQPIDLSEPNRLAYMIYTSGSTGLPKGVMLPHLALRAFLSWRIAKIGITPESRHAEHASFSFDASLDDLLCPLAAGGQVHIFSETMRRDMDGMAKYVEKHGITGMTLSTQMGMALVNQYELPLQYLMMGGEKMLPMRKTSVKLINGYGPTEFSVCSSLHVVDQQKDTDIPIGRPVPNSYSFICDEQGFLLPQGVMGELCLSGDQMARGYWKRPELTEEKFVDCPFAPGKRMYRTGDLAYYDANGELEFCGRVDNQVKLRGFRIEFGEIENCARTYDGIQMVIATVQTINDTGHLCMYYTADRDIDAEALRVHMEQSLTDYMIPEAMVRMDAMPMTPNGKIDRKKLPVPEIKVDTECMPPATKREVKLYDIARELLGHDQFGVTDNLMRVGMTSLLVIRLVAKACSEGIMIKVDDFMRTKTIRGVLATNQRLMTWYEEPVAGKPVAVVVQGETRYNDLLPYIQELNSRYNVVIVEAITAHFDYLFKDDDISEAIEFYYTLLDVELMQAGLESVALFTGHCFGSDLAYRLACRWQQENPELPVSVCMLDSFWVDNDRQLERPQLDLSMLPENIQQKIADMNDEQNELTDMYQRLNCHGNPEPLRGHVVLISAAQKENIVAQIAVKLGVQEQDVTDMLKVDADTLRQFLIPQREIDNVALWSGFCKDLRYWKVYGDHMTMLNEQNVKTYMQFVFDNIK